MHFLLKMLRSINDILLERRIEHRVDALLLVTSKKFIDTSIVHILLINSFHSIRCIDLIARHYDLFFIFIFFVESLLNHKFLILFWNFVFNWIIQWVDIHQGIKKILIFKLIWNHLLHRNLCYLWVVFL